MRIIKQPKVSYFVELDTVDIEEAKFQEWLTANSIQFSVLSEHGPVDTVRYTGTVENLARMIRDFWQDEGLCNYIMPIDQLETGG